MKLTKSKLVIIIFFTFIFQYSSQAQVVTGGDFFIGTGLITLNQGKAENFQVGKTGWSGVGLSGGVVFFKRFVTNIGGSYGGSFPNHYSTESDNDFFIQQFWLSFIEGGIIQSIIPFNEPDAEVHSLLFSLTTGYNAGITLERMHDEGKGFLPRYEENFDIPGEFYLSPGIFINLGEKGMFICLSYRHFLKESGMQNIFLFQFGFVGVSTL
jgi:hypothetical protein